MSLDQIINLLVTITLIVMMILIGLRVTFAELSRTISDWQLLVRAAVANCLVVPCFAVLLLIQFNASPMVSAGLLVLAVCPGAPFGPPLARIARADVPQSIGLMVILAGSSAILSPLLLNALLPWLTGSTAARINLADLVIVLLITQLVPLLVGVLLKYWKPHFADRITPLFDRASQFLNLSVAGLIIATQFSLLANIHLRGFAGIAMLLIGSLVAGWFAGGSSWQGRKTMALTTSLRNIGLGLLIVTGNFAGTPAVSAALTYGIFEVLGSLLVALWWRHASHPAEFA
ncbi:MAG TPA: bile acid:sodium symporter [Xanthobacteraceae bacterium]|jgi:BASS family bile acid:Na+ symporter|nr:bile acid:sodium symporter [Xanthobacteraceae bacterium]